MKEEWTLSDATGEANGQLCGFPKYRKGRKNLRNLNYQLEAVTKAQPLLLKQHLEAANGAVVTVQHEHGQRGELACAVPAIATVHHH